MRERRGPSRPSGRLIALALAAAAAASVTGYAANLALASQNLTVYRTCIITATPSTTAAVADTYVVSNTATTNFGTATTMDVRSGNTGDRRVYASFDLTQCSPTIPSSDTIQTALLRTFVTAMAGTCRTYDLYRVTGAWTETGITWNTQPTIGSLTASIDIGTPGGCQNNTNTVYVSGWNVVADVQAFVSGSATNRGWMIRDSTEGAAPARTATFATKNTNVLARAPQLVVVYRA